MCELPEATQWDQSPDQPQPHKPVHSAEWQGPLFSKAHPLFLCPVGHSSGSDSSSAGEVTRGTVLPALPSMFGGPVASGKNCILGIW